MIDQLINNGCIKYGSFKLKSNEISKYYFDMKSLISYPNLLKEIGDEIYKKIGNDCDILCGVPLGGLPVCSYVSTQYNIPMIMVRDEVKQYGTNKQIEGNYRKEDKCIIIEDVITTGGSVNKVIDILKDKVDIIGVIVIMDRQEGYICDIPVKSVVTKTDVIRYRLNQLITQKKSKLCFSADITDKKKLLSILEYIGDKIVICKIHYDFYEDNDCSLKNKLIELSIKHEFLLMEDRKFVDISYTVSKQYSKFNKWIDLITVMGNVSNDVIDKLSGVILVANMSNNSFDSTENAIKISEKYPNRVIGFVTQYRIGDEGKFVNMTPGINVSTCKIEDQNYRKKEDVDTDIFIVGRAIYNSENVITSAEQYKNYKSEF